MDAADIINSSKQQTGSFKTRSFLQFGLNVSLYTTAASTLTDYLKGVNDVDPGIVVIAKDCIVQTASIATTSAMTLMAIDSAAETTLTLQKASLTSNTWSDVGQLIFMDDQDHGDYGKYVSNLNLSLSAGDRVRVKIYLNADDEMDEVTIPYPQVTLGLLSE